MAKHPPAHHREVLRLLREGAHPLDLVDEALSITDPGHAAGALSALAADARVPVGKAAELAHDALALLAALARPGRVAEAWGPVLERLAERGGHGWDGVMSEVRQAAVAAVAAMPDGTWTRDAIAALAPPVGPQGREGLLPRALENAGLEIESAKAVLRAAGPDEPAWDRAADAPPSIAARLAAFRAAHGHGAEEAIREAWAVPDRAERHEALRVLVWNTDSADGLAAIAASVKGKEPMDAAHVLTTVGAREDRLGLGAPRIRFEAAGRLLPELGKRARDKAARKLAQAMERAGLATEGSPPEASAEGAVEAKAVAKQVPNGPEHPPTDGAAPPSGAEAPQGLPHDPVPPHEVAPPPQTAPAARHVLALVDGHRSMGPPQVRAVARAAPLCIAFGLDLALIGFPTDAAAVVDLVERDSGVGEGGGHARRLLDEGRLEDIALEKGVPAHWPAHPLATTPHPDPAKAVALEDAPRPVCLVVGLGPTGLPRRLMNAAPRHHELTGQGISLETATAMGILADRLGRLPVADG